MSHEIFANVSVPDGPGWWNVEIVQRQRPHWHYMRTVLHNGYGEPVARFKFRSWKSKAYRNQL
jgi:hypothetical protein